MAITYVSSASLSEVTSTSKTDAVDVGATTDRLLIVTIFGDVSASSLITGVTFNGVALTYISGIQTPTDRFTEMWYLLNPASGSHNLVETASGSTKIGVAYAVYNGVKQATALETSATATGTSVVTKTFTLTTSHPDAMIVVGAKDTMGVLTGGANTTVRLNSNAQTFADYITSDTPGSHSVILNGPSGNIAGVVASFLPSSVTISASDTQTPVDSMTATLAQVVSVSDTQTPTDSAKARFGFSDQSKSSSTLTNTQKS